MNLNFIECVYVCVCVYDSSHTHLYILTIQFYLILLIFLQIFVFYFFLLYSMFYLKRGLDFIFMKSYRTLFSLKALSSLKESSLEELEFLEYLVILQRSGAEWDRIGPWAQPLDYSTCGKHDGTSEHRNVS